MSAAKAQIDLIARDYASSQVTGFTNKMEKLRGKLTSLSHWAMGSLFAQGGVFAGAIKSASDLEETTSKFDVVFGKQADSVKNWADTTAKEMGRSKKQVRSFMSETQDLFVPLGFDAESAEGISKTITKLAIDLASFNNVSDEDAFRNITSAMVGNAEAMKKYGVIINESTVAQWAFQNGLNPKKLSEQQKVLARLNITLDMTKAAQGDTVRTLESFANNFKKLKSDITDAAAALGGTFLTSIGNVVSAFSKLAIKFSEFTEKNQRLVAGVFTAVAAIGAFLVVAPRLVTAISLISKAVTFLSANPLIAVITLIGSLAGYFLVASQTGNTFGEKISNLVTSIQEFANSIVSFLSPAFSWLTSAFSSVVAYIKPMWEDFSISLQAAWSQLYEVLTPITSAIGEFITSAWEKMKAFVLPVVEGIRKGISTAFLFLSFIIKNWRLSLEYAFVASAYHLVKFANQVQHFFTKVIPAYLIWFKDNWKEVFQSIWNGVKTFTVNVWENLKNLWTAIKGLFAGEGWEFKWTGLMDGFESTIKELPKIAAREAGPLEKKLAENLSVVGEQLNAKWKEHKDEYTQRVNDLAKPSFDAPTVPSTSGGNPSTKPVSTKDGAVLPDIASLPGSAAQSSSKASKNFESLTSTFKRIQAKAAESEGTQHLKTLVTETQKKREQDVAANAKIIEANVNQLKEMVKHSTVLNALKTTFERTGESIIGAVRAAGVLE